MALLTTDLTRRIDKKRKEIVSLEREVAKAEAYIEAMQDALKLVERMTAAPRHQQESGLRNGSFPAKALPVLQRSGRPMHLVALLDAMGEPANTKNKRAVASSLSAYARKGDIFTRTAPNTFGLIEFGDSASSFSEEPSATDDAPAEPAPVRLIR